MAGAGRNYRYDPGIVTPGAMLPTAEAVALAKGFAARACAERAASAMWANRDHAHTWVDRSPTLALAVLVRLCPEVAPERLAACLGLDPVYASRRLETLAAGGSPPCPDDLVEVVAQQVTGGA